jgi:cell division protein FtsW (lipid II flippase)
MLTSIWAVGVTIACAWVGGDEETRLRRALYAWRLLPCPLLLWLMSASLAHGFKPEMAAALAVWATGWGMMHYLLRPETLPTALGLMPAFGLAGIGLGAVCDLSIAYKYPWILRQASVVGGQIVLGVVAVIMGLRFPALVDQLSRPTGIRVALGLVVAAFLLRVVPQTAGHGWAPALLAFLIGVTAVASRTASGLAIPVSAVQWLHKWRWSILMAMIPTTITVVFRPDFSPGALAAAALMFAFAALGERLAAVLLFLLAAGLVLNAYLVGQPALLVNRIQDSLKPQEAESSQGIGCIWAISRGGLFGRGVGHFVLSDGRCACTEGDFRYPATALAITDGIFAYLVEAIGVVGTLAVLLLYMLSTYWLWWEVKNASSLWRRCWFAVVMGCFALSALWTIGWVTNRWCVMGLATPFLSAGYVAGLFWGILFAVSAASAVSRPASYWSVPSRREAIPLASRLILVLPQIALLISSVEGLLKHGWYARETAIMLVYQDRRTENLCRDALLKGWFLVSGGRIVIDRVKLRSENQSQQVEERLRRCLLYLRLTEDGRIVVDPVRFSQGEPSGLGQVVRLAGEDR